MSYQLYLLRSSFLKLPIKRKLLYGICFSHHSNISRIDDIREEQRLASHNNVSPHPGDSEESSTQLRELLKIEREQKVLELLYHLLVCSEE